MKISHERLKQCIRYNHDDGTFIRLNGQRAGKQVGYNKDGYICICIDDKEYMAHRLAWFYMMEEWPENDIDHWDLNRSNNTWSNLRHCTRAQNMLNTNAHKDSGTGVKNVSWRKDISKYSVRISIDGKYKCLGTFDELELATLVAEEARIKYHGQYAR